MFMGDTIRDRARGFQRENPGIFGEAGPQVLPWRPAGRDRVREPFAVIPMRQLSRRSDLWTPMVRSYRTSNRRIFPCPAPFVVRAAREMPWSPDQVETLRFGLIKLTTNI